MLCLNEKLFLNETKKPLFGFSDKYLYKLPEPIAENKSKASYTVVKVFPLITSTVIETSNVSKKSIGLLQALSINGIFAFKVFNSLFNCDNMQIDLRIMVSL